MNSTYLSDPWVKARFHLIWERHANLGFFGKLRRVVKFYRGFCTSKAKALKAAEVLLRQQLEAATAALHGDPYSDSLQSQVGVVGEQLKEFEIRQA